MSKKLSWWIYSLISLGCSKLFFFTLDDSEGANLFIVTILAGVLFLFSLFLDTRLLIPYPRRFWLIVLLQLLVTIGFAWGLH